MLETKCVRMAPVAERPQRLDGHDEPEIGAADADVDDVRDGLPGVAPVFARTPGVGEVQHAAEFARSPPA